ncbi:di-heme oxidoredictase family protein [Xanthobacter sp. KR7-225]|uniref:di-heme oxidoredictase family protein n=1 Tax=Xanthobacter sp. KR7-225 TaxID=3156613 RepID=UPI0032B5E189
MSARRLLAAAGALLLLLPQPAGALDQLDIKIGKALFKRPWVPAPASTRGDDGLGPLFDARSCASCHPKDGRAAARFDAEGHLEGRGVVLMIGAPDGAGDPVYGRRLQIDAAPGIRAEGVLGARDEFLPDGRRARHPQASDLGYGPLAPPSGVSLRVAPDLYGRGAMARITDADILALEAEQARAGGEVSGRARRIARPDGRVEIGRFGWKSAHPTLREQIAEAFFLDLGMSNPLHGAPWGDCTPSQAACRNAPHGQSEGSRGPEGNALEIGDPILSRVVAYVATLPVRAPDGAPSEEGARLFAATGCAACHRPQIGAGADRARLFSDLLLHDLGEGLKDGMAEPGIAPTEWRTAPLAGLSDALARATGLLHDGRARDVPEAIAWHGGEAASALRRFNALTGPQKAALVAYVSSL